ncbi:MAG: diadenylate cyclase CdaA [Polyangiaceae bacterium]|nr:diadenylate cyclase CdaA [Polyangiaceae bacterium]
MPEVLTAYFGQRTFADLARDGLDVFIVYYVTYRALLIVKGTRAQHVSLGLLAVFGLYVVAQQLQLMTVLTILSSLISSFILVVVVVFQNDIRRGLQRVGSRAWLPGQAHAKASQVLDEVVEAATDLARHRTGALIAIEQEANLDEFVGVNKGKEIDAAVTSELLVSLFVPDGMNKLHDGAVIIRNHRIAKAGVFFPMPEGRVLAQHLGSRHRAALGITEETDAVVVVVSEERGTISYCFNGNHVDGLNGTALRAAIESIYHPRQRRKPRATPSPPPPSVAEPPATTRTDDEPVEDISTTLQQARSELDAGAGRASRLPDEPRASPRSEPPPPLRPRASAAEVEGMAGSAAAPRVATIPRERLSDTRPLPVVRVVTKSEADEDTPPSGGSPP